MFTPSIPDYSIHVSTIQIDRIDMFILFAQSCVTKFISSLRSACLQQLYRSTISQQMQYNSHGFSDQ